MNAPMRAPDATYLAVVVFVYALHEFLLKRVIWGTSGVYAGRGRAAASQGMLLFLLLCVGSLGFISAAVAAGYAVLASAYAACEFLRGRGSAENVARRSLEWFVLTQVVVGLLLALVWRVSSPLTVHHWYVEAEGAVFGHAATTTAFVSSRCALVLSIAAAYFFVVDGGTRLVRGILDKFPGLYRRASEYLAGYGEEGGDDLETEEHVGEWIGILERVITLTFVLTGNFTAIAFVLTAKSIARFEALEKSKAFAEYYLLGTSGSMIAALGAGMTLRLLFAFP